MGGLSGRFEWEVRMEGLSGWKGTLIVDSR